MTRSLDTTAEAERIRFDRLREMSTAERSRLMCELTLAVQRLALAGLRMRFPEGSEEELMLRLAVQRLGPDLVRKVYGRVPGEN